MSDTVISTESYKEPRKKDVFEGTPPEVKERTKKMLMYLIIFSVIMMFGGWVSAYIVMEPQSYWVHPKPVSALFTSNVLLVISSVLLILAGYFAKQNKQQLCTALLIGTFLGGAGFAYSQFQAHKQYNEMGFFLSFNKIGMINAEYGEENDYFVTLNGYALIYENGQFYAPTDKDRLEPVTEEMKRHQDNASSLLFLLIAVHVFHVVLGLIYLIVNIIRSMKGTFSEGNTLSLRTQGIYWHFMGILWLILYAFLFIIY